MNLILKKIVNIVLSLSILDLLLPCWFFCYDYICPSIRRLNKINRRLL